MSPEPKGNQKKIIDGTEGIYLVDAGAGTGKTFTVSRRYARLLDKGAKPEEIFLATFTENAAENMKEEIINYCNYDLSELREAPISTFHGFCHQLLLREGFKAPGYLGLDDVITVNTRTISNQVQENREFSNFYDSFQENHPEYGNYFRIVYERSNLLELIKSLAVKGVFPMESGWHRDGDKLLLGNFSEYLEKLERVNTPLPGKRGKKQSELLNRLTGMKNMTFNSEEVTGKGDVKSGKQVDPGTMKEAFNEDRGELVEFIHDIYFEYINYALGRNYLNFSFQLMFAFVLLMENDRLRDSTQFDYVMIDEFQDTNEIQFKLSLLLSRTGNILAVGDWKQSIFGFQYASVENITEFEKRLREYYRQINRDQQRTLYSPGEVEEIPLRRNYRSSQEILDFSEGALKVKGKKREDVRLNREVVSLEAVESNGETGISAFVSECEVDAVLERLVEVVEGNEYKLDGDNIDYKDVAIFSRNRGFARELDKKARQHGVPVAYEGGAEIFKSDPGIILLAWLRVMEREHSKRGWSVILDEAGYNVAEVERTLEGEDFPPDALKFRARLEKAYDIGEVARKVFVRYGFDNTFTDAIIEVLQSTFDSSYMNLGSVVQFIERNISEGETYDVDSPREEAATVQTIHSAKGLEYPVVFLANMNSHTFPSTNTDGKRIFYDDMIGLRSRKVYSEADGFLYDNLAGYLTSRVSGVDYDEERRLLYVALTRAKNYLFLSAEKGSEGRFFKDLDVEPVELKPELCELEFRGFDKSKDLLRIGKPESTRPEKKAVHSVVNISPEDQSGGRGTEFGTMIHGFAEQVARGEKASISEGEEGKKDKENVRSFIRSLPGELLPEQEVLIPKYEEGSKYVYHGSIDLVHVLDDRVQVIDFKTDEERINEPEYKKQLSLYREAVSADYPHKNVTGHIYYTESDQLVDI
ncbi:MAG: UvrD-helicase domain-containing protein [Candidatus Bipolaricaulota bacterium]|nr:UvrD-helicase domain-containing protein [Candidatus Bipolaricaulota bacterium]MBS3791590.1 UvrD-helicase domain-containing protein [Candidatus Bipolaricaulota bacterium]